MKPDKYSRHAELLKNDRLAYANRWNEKNAGHFERSGYYDWMSKFVDDYSLILEIGTGTGQSTVSLLKRGHTVVGIDENPNCLEIAERNIRDSGFEVTVRPRGIVNPQYYGYNVKYRRPEAEIIDKGALLLEGDVNNDSALQEWLIRNKPFDAVVCWLIGTHTGRPSNKVMINSRINNDGDYRLFVQNEVYEIAERVLRKDGILHIVDRGERTNDAAHIQETFDSHREQASTTSLVIESVESLPYEDPPDTGAQPMVVTLGTSGRIPTNFDMSFWSVMSRKP